MQRYAESTQVTGHAYAVLGGGSPTDLAGVGSLYGDKLSLERDVYSVPSASPNEATPWIAYTLEVAESRYVLKADNRIIANCSFSIPNYDYFGYLSLNCCTANILVDDFAVSVKDETLPPEILPLTAPVVKLDEAAKKSHGTMWTGQAIIRLPWTEKKKRFPLIFIRSIVLRQANTASRSALFRTTHSKRRTVRRATK